MVRVVFESQDGSRVELNVEAEGSLMQAAKKHSVPGIDADCGGCMSCGTCHVIIDPVWHDRLPAQGDIERELLQYVPDPQPDTRLTCQIPVSVELDGIVLRIPARQR